MIDRLRAERDEARAALETERARTAACFQTWKAEVIALLARIETAERELSALLAGKRWPAIERIKRDTEARIVAWLRSISTENTAYSWQRQMTADRIERGDHRKGVDDGK